MAETNGEGGKQALKPEDLSRAVLSSSTKLRISTLNALAQKVRHDELTTPALIWLIRLLFDTYPLYIDRVSRRAAESCLRYIIASPKASESLAALVNPLSAEVAKVSLAPANYFVLTEWSCIILEELTLNLSLWSKWWQPTLIALSAALEQTLSLCRQTVVHSAIILSRRALRSILRNEKLSQEATPQMLTVLTKKTSTSTAKNSVLLGVVAGVCARIEQQRSIFENEKQSVFTFYTREIIGSRVPLPPHIADGLRDLFKNFVSLEDFTTDIVPPIEKALLRAPEVVLNDLISPLILSLPEKIDVSGILLHNLLRPLLSNVKSSNPTIRSGALRTFQTLTARSQDEAALEKVADDLLTPLRQNKITNVDQKILHAQMLASIRGSQRLVQKIPEGLGSLALKEPSEAVIESQLRASATQIRYAFQTATGLQSISPDIFVKGITDKRTSVRRLWALHLGSILWDLPRDIVIRSSIIEFVAPILAIGPKILTEIASNPVLAATNGLATAASVLLALSFGSLGAVKEDDAKTIIDDRASLAKILAWDGKPSFLLNPRVVSKLVGKEDALWASRAVAELAPVVGRSSVSAEAKISWVQAFLYFCTSALVSYEVRQEAHELLTKTSNQHNTITKLLLEGIWTWLRQLAEIDKESMAVASKSDTSVLTSVLRSICSPSESQDRDSTMRHQQIIQLLVLARPQLIPKTSWIDLCLRMNVDPGQLVSNNVDACMQQIVSTPTQFSGNFAALVRQAAHSAAADLAFVAPETAIPVILEQLKADLEVSQLEDIGPTEAAIFRTPQGTAYIDVLATKPSDRVVDKKTKDYDTMKWEQELRDQLAKQGKLTKKLTADEQAKVNAQLAKESDIRTRLTNIFENLQRGVGIIHALATGPPTEAERWIVQAVDLLQEIINAGAGLVLGNEASLVYLDCSSSITARLGPLRSFVGVATLRAMGVKQMPIEYTTEPLNDQITRVLYRLQFLGNQRSFDTVSLAYMLPLVFLVLEYGGFATKGSEENDVQRTLALELVTAHADNFVNERLPRAKVLAAVIAAMQRYNQHYKLTKDCLQALINAIEPNISKGEIQILLEATIVPQSSVRTAVLQSIDNDLDLSNFDYLEEIWIASHDIVPDNSDLARTIWTESNLSLPESSSVTVVKYLASTDRQLRQATAYACAESVQLSPQSFAKVLEELQSQYLEAAKPRIAPKDAYGIPQKVNLADLWEHRSGVALALHALAPVFASTHLVEFVRFLIEKGPLGDRNATVRDEMIAAATAIIASAGSTKVEALMTIFETALESADRGQSSTDQVNEAIIILYGALARHLESGDKRIPTVVGRLLDTLSTPSETVQYAVAKCLPPLVKASDDRVSEYIQKMLDELLQSKKYANQRGAAYGLAGIVEGRGIVCLREHRIMSTLQGAAGSKKESNQRQGAFLAYELLSLILGRLFEPYIIQIVPQLLAGFGDANADVREACLDASKTCFQTLTSFGVKRILPMLLEGLDESAWRSKKGACDLLGAMAYLDPQQLAESLPEIIPPLANVLNDSHKEVRAAANRSLQRFGEVITNPEIKSIVSVLLKALSDPSKHTDEALQALTNIQFAHFLDSPSLSLVVRILERGLGDRSSTKRRASGIIGNLAHLTDRKDLTAHLPILVSGLRVAMVDPVPETRGTSSKALGSLVAKLGEESFPDLIPSLMMTLRSDTGAGDRLGSAQGLSEVLAGLGTARLEETLPSILQNVSSTKPNVREGFMSLFIFLPACFGTSFSNYLGKIIPPILAGLADEIDTIRTTALKAGKLLVKNFANKSIDLLLPELERGLGDDSYRIRLSSVELVGDLLFTISGISAKTDEEDDIAAGATEAGHSLLEVLGEEKRNRVLSALYICRCDTSGLVRTEAINVWKALVATPRILREIVPTLTQLIIRRLASSNMEQKVIAGNALGELIRKAGEGVLATLLPTLEEGLESTDPESRQGICMALRDLITSASPDSIEEYEKTLVSVVRKALVDSDGNVRDAAAEAFDALQGVMGKRAVDQVLPHLLSLLRSEDEADNALSALLTLLTDHTRSNIILPNLLPPLLTSPISSFNANAIASLAEVASSAMTRRLPNIINALVDNIISCKNETLASDLNTALDTVLLSVDENDGLNTMMSVMLALTKHDDHRKRQTGDEHLAVFVAKNDIDISRYYPDLIRAFLIAFDDRDSGVVKAAWTAMSELTKRLRKEDMEALVISTRGILKQAGTAGHNLPGFELPKGINAVLPIFLQGLMYGTPEQRTESALAIADIIDRASADALKPFVTQITGPLIRVVSERSTDVKAAILYTLNLLLEKIPTFLKPFLPQLQRTFAKSLADTGSELLRIRAAKALGTLILMTPRIDPLIAELVTGSKTPDAGVKTAMLKALYEVVSKAGANMSEASKNSILAVIDSDANENDEALAITNAKLLGVLIKVLPNDAAHALIKNRVLCSSQTKQSILALNAVLLEAPDSIADSDDLLHVICDTTKDTNPSVSDNAVLAAGKYLLSDSISKSFESTKQLLEALANVIPPGHAVDIRRLALVVIRTVSRRNNTLVRPHTPILVQPIFASVRDMVIPVKLSAEAAFLELFNVVDEESTVFDKYINGPGASLPAAQKKSMQDYFKRVVLRLAGQARERREAEGGAGGLGLSSDEVEDEREIWSVGKVDLGEGSFND